MIEFLVLIGVYTFIYCLYKMAFGSDRERLKWYNKELDEAIKRWGKKN